MDDNLPKEQRLEGLLPVGQGAAVSFLEEALAKSNLKSVVKKYSEALGILNGLRSYGLLDPKSQLFEPPIIMEWRSVVNRLEQTAAILGRMFLERTDSLETLLAKLPGVVNREKHEGKYMFFYMWAHACLTVAHLYHYNIPSEMAKVQGNFERLEELQLVKFGSEVLEASDRQMGKYLTRAVGKRTINKYFATCEKALQSYAAAASVYDIAKGAGVELNRQFKALPEEMPPKILNFMLSVAKWTGRQDILDRYSSQRG